MQTRWFKGARARSGASVTCAALVLAAAVTGCGSSNGSAASSNPKAAKDAPVGGGTATLSIGADWPTLDIQTNAINSNAPLVIPAYDRLLARAPDGKVVPYVASSYTVTPTEEPSSVTFKIRSDVKCNDGHVLTPSDIQASFQRWISVKKTGVNAMPNYFGPGPYHLSSDNAAGTFTFKTETPFRNLAAGFANGPSVIYCPAALKDPKALENKSLGSGPYNMVSATHGSEVVYQRRDDWTWGPMGTTYKTLPEKLIYKVIPDFSTQANLLLTGAIDVTATSVSGPDVSRLAANKSLIYKKATNYHVYTLTFNMYPGRITNDESVRAALMAVVDPSAWNKAAYQGRGIVANGSTLTPTQDCFSESIHVDPPSIDRAKQLLQQGGWTQTNGHWTKNGKPLKLTLLGDQRQGAGNEYLLNQFRQLGVDITLQSKDAATVGGQTIAGNFDIAVPGYTLVSKEPGQDLAILSGPTPPNGINVGDTGRGDAEYASLAKESLRFAGDKGCAALQKFNQRMLDKHYGLPMATEPYALFGSGTWDFAPLASWFEVAYLKRLK